MSTWIKRIGFFLLTNFLIITMISVVWSVLTMFFPQLQSTSMFGLAIFSLVWGMAGSLFGLMISKWSAKNLYGVQLIDENTTHPDMRRLLNKVHGFARQAGLEKMPEVGIYESMDVNAFATGPSKNNSMVAVSSGLLQRMTDEEVDGVLGHEVAHIANGDMVTMTLIQGIVNAFVLFFSRIAGGLVASQVEERNRPLVRMLANIVFQILFSLLGSIAVAYFSRIREFRADEGGARLAGKQNMISALQRLKSLSQLPYQGPEEDSLATMKISSGGKNLMHLFTTHPPLEDRIAALKN